VCVRFVFGRKASWLFGQLRASQVHESVESYVDTFLVERSCALPRARQKFSQQQVIDKERVDHVLCRGAVRHCLVARRLNAFAGGVGQARAPSPARTKGTRGEQNG
jgi:hypothetical protein